MHEPQERVEFFHSESSFGSQSNLSESRYYDFTNELIAETDNIFLTLKRELQPIEGPAQKDKVEFALRRALILKKDTIPQHIAYLNKIEAPHNARIQVDSCEERLGKLLADNEKLKNGTMIYKQFYNIYGKEYGLKDDQFSRKKEALKVETQPEAIIQPEYIEVSYNSDRKKLKGATPRVFMAPATIGNQKEVAALREEMYKLKKALDDERKHHETQLINQKMSSEKRMRAYLQNTQTNTELQNTLKKELEYYSERLSKSQEEKKKLQEYIEEQTKTIDMLKHENLSLKEQIQILRKTENSFSEELQPNNRSYNSQANEKQERKMEKKLKNLAQENELLKNQLKTERQRLYRLQGDLTDEERRELERNRKNLEKKKTELEELYSDFDKQRIEILQLNYNNKSNVKIVETLKRENDELKYKAEKSSNLYASPTVLTFPNLQRSLQASKNSSKLQVHEYQGDGLQGYPYYQILNKQFKIRFRRACLKEKQLLYKSNGVEIGVITEFAPPNSINLLIHLTNYSQNKFEKVKGKVMNANENKIQGDSFEFVTLMENEQVKIPVSLAINQYPIGPLILLLEFSTDKKEEIRILLPAHIFKTMIFQPRGEEIDAANSAKLAITSERKICKDLNQAKQYFKDYPITHGRMKLVAFNYHTHNVLWLDLLQTKEGMELIYQHKEGNHHITDYFIKTLTFLLSKQAIK